MTIGSVSPEILVYPDWVIIEGVKVPRPRRISPSQWLKFWESVVEKSIGYDDGYEDGFFERRRMWTEYDHG